MSIKYFIAIDDTETTIGLSFNPKRNVLKTGGNVNQYPTITDCLKAYFNIHEWVIHHPSTNKIRLESPCTLQAFTRGVEALSGAMVTLQSTRTLRRVMR